MSGRAPARAGPAALALSLALAATALAAEEEGAAEPTARLESVERALEAERREGQQLKRRAAALEQEMERLRDESVAAARAIQDHEREADALEARLFDLADVERRGIAGLARERDRFARVLAALQRLARYPPEALIAEPWHPADAVRSAIALRSALPEIDRRAQRLGRSLAELAAARAEMERRRGRLQDLALSLDGERRRLDELLARKAELKRRTDADAEKAAARARSLADEAASIKDLLARLEDERRLELERLRRERERLRKPEAEAPAKARAKEAAKEAAKESAKPAAQPPAGGTPIEAARGTLSFPVVGRLVGQYGQALGTGLTRKGIEIETRAGAQVVATYAGRVMFAGPFRGYGLLLIIEHGDGYHSLLSGMADIESPIGHWIVAGEPVGVMGRPDGAKPVLYMELRRNGQPINPLPWLASRESKVSG
jgi:septal ring factor EnvC (AmiA/AmiB activator)